MAQERRRPRGRLGRVPFLGPRLQAAIHARRKRARSAESVTRHNTRRAYERLYASDVLLADYRSPDRMRFYEEVAERAAALRPATVLDVGCGSGDLLAALARLAPDAQLAGVDHAASAIDRARTAVPRGRFVVADLAGARDALGGGRYDLVLCTEVLEHVARPETALAALADCRAEGGVLLVTVPDGAVDDFEGHVSFWDAAALTRFLSAAGPPAVERMESGPTLLALVPGD